MPQQRPRTTGGPESTSLLSSQECRSSCDQLCRGRLCCPSLLHLPPLWRSEHGGPQPRRPPSVSLRLGRMYSVAGRFEFAVSLASFPTRWTSCVAACVLGKLCRHASRWSPMTFHHPFATNFATVMSNRT